MARTDFQFGAPSRAERGGLLGSPQPGAALRTLSEIRSADGAPLPQWGSSLKLAGGYAQLPPAFSLAEARALGEKRYYTGIPCKHGHQSPCFVSNRRCVECFYMKRREKYVADPEPQLAAQRAWASLNPEKKRAAERRWHEANRERAKTVKRVWSEQNRASLNARQARRRSAEKLATPAWADREAISKIYAEALRLSTQTGIPHHVDHIIPLNGRDVCGLHVESNLRAIPASANLTKSNKLEIG